MLLVGLIVLFIGCESAGAGDNGSSGGDDGTGTDGNGNSSTCDKSTNYTVEWKFSGSYSDNVSVATTWVKPSGEISDPSDTKYATINPVDGTLLTETLPGCTGASINIIMIDPSDGSDDDKTVTPCLTSP